MKKKSSSGKTFKGEGEKIKWACSGKEEQLMKVSVYGQQKSGRKQRSRSTRRKIMGLKGKY